MLLKHLKIALRKLRKNRTASLINITGLAVGMAVAMLIGLWAQQELTANHHHPHFKSLYQVMMHQTFDGKRNAQVALPYPTGEELRAKYPDFEAVAMCDWGDPHALATGAQKLSRKGYFISADAIQMFSFPILQGDKSGSRSHHRCFGDYLADGELSNTSRSPGQSGEVFER